jgi:ribonuclease HI
MPTSCSVSHLVRLSRSLPTHLLPRAYPSVDCRSYFVDTPPSGWLKCNVDGAFYEQQWQGATGAVLHDDNGAFVRGGAKWYGHYLDALNMEALACRDGLLMARQVHAQRVWLETDCQELLKLWRTWDNQWSSVMPILTEIRDLSLLFHNFNFSFISRNCNRVAHTLAKQVTSGTQVGWWHQTPTCVLSLLTSYCNPSTLQ